jgi:hypothetical protein
MAITGWRAIQDAIQAAMAAAAALPPEKVLWAFQNVNQPANPYLKLSIPGLLTKGQDWLSQAYDATRPAGQEIELQPMGTREVAIELQAFTDEVADESSAHFYLDGISTALIRPSIRDLLTAVGVSIFDPQGVQYAPAVVAANFRGRATATLRSYIPAQAASEYVGYIRSFRGTLTSAGSALPPVAAPWAADVE